MLCRDSRALRTARAIGEGVVDPLEAQARAIIAASLIVSGAVEIPALPLDDRRALDAAGVRLRELTDYVYRLVTEDQPHELK